MSDKYGYDDLFWVYPPDFVLRAEKKNYFYKLCASFCLRLRFDYDTRVLPREDPDPLISRRPPSVPESINRSKSTHTLAPSIGFNKDKDFEPNENQMTVDESPSGETSGLNDKYKVDVEPAEEDIVGLQPDVKEEECEDDFKELLLTNKAEEEEECDDDFKEVIFINKPDEVTDDGITHDIDNSALEKDGHLEVSRLEVSQCKVQEEKNEVANDWHGILAASTPNGCTDLIESKSDGKCDIDEEVGDNNAGDEHEDLIEKDTEPLKTDQDDPLRENRDGIYDEKDKIEEITDIIPVQVPPTVDSGDIGEKKDHAVENPKEETEGKGAKRKKSKRKGKKKAKKKAQKEKSLDGPIPKQDVASVVETILESKENAKETKKKAITAKREESTPDVSESDTLKPAGYLWRRLSRSIVRDFRLMQNNNNAHRSEDTDFAQDEDMKTDTNQLREEYSNESENKNSNENYGNSEGILPERSDALPEICVIMPEESVEDAAWKADYEALIREAEQSTSDLDVFVNPEEEMNSTEENTVESSGYRAKKMKPAWVNPLDMYKSQAVNAELSSPENKALQKAYSKKPPPKKPPSQHPPSDNKRERKESVFSIGSTIPAIDI